MIGAQKAATTTLWQGIDSHPEIATPSDKERGFFNSDGRYARGLEAFLAAAFPGPGPGQLLGTVTPDYMPAGDDQLDTIVERMHATVPQVRLVAILRDPVERAVSHYRTGLRTGNATLPTFDAHYAEVCRQRGVRFPPLVRRGEYGRILSRYLDRFPADQLLVLWTDDLEHAPDAVFARVFAFLGVDAAHTPARERLNVGGTRRRVSAQALAELEAHFDQELWPLVSPERREDLRRGTRWWLEHLWNTVPDDEATEVGPALRRMLVEHFTEDGRRLRERLGVEPPWLAGYEAELAA